MYLECKGTGSPSVVLISGKGNGAADWSEILDPADPVHDANYDAVARGKGDLHKSDTAVFPMVSRFTRVCAYDRPDVRLDGPDRSTPFPSRIRPIRRPTISTGCWRPRARAGPYVLVPHSYGGVVATLFARTWPEEVAGLVMVDTVTPLMREVASPEAVAKWDAFNRRSVPEAPEAVMLLDAFAKIDAAAPLRELPAVVLAADKPWLPPSAAGRRSGGGRDLRGLAGIGGAARESLSAKFVTKRTAATTSTPTRPSSSSMPFARWSMPCGTEGSRPSRWWKIGVRV